MQTILRPAFYGLGLTLLWVVLASNNPTITYHLAPLLVAGAVPAGSALTDRPVSAAAATAVGLTLTYGATVGLGLADRLMGPSLLPSGGAVLEGFVFGAIGAIGGLVFVIWHRQ